MPGRRKQRRRRSGRGRARKLGLRLLFATLAVGLLAVAGCRWLEAPPRNTEDACSTLRQKPSWYASLRASETEWKTPKSVQLAILVQESSLRARARPPRRKLLRILPWRRTSSAYGYGQILDGTWQDYQSRRGRPRAKRTSFDDVADFVGWYIDQIHQQTGIDKSDAYGLYLAYHEGPTGYQRGTHQQKAWLLRTAGRVQTRADRYREQLGGCEGSLWLARLRLNVIQGTVLIVLALLLYLGLRRRLRSAS